MRRREARDALRARADPHDGALERTRDPAQAARQLLDGRMCVCCENALERERASRAARLLLGGRVCFVMVLSKRERASRVVNSYSTVVCVMFGGPIMTRPDTLVTAGAQSRRRNVMCCNVM